MKVYSLIVSLNEIIRHYEDEKSREFASAMEAIQKLRKMAAKTRTIDLRRPGRY